MTSPLNDGRAACTSSGPGVFDTKAGLVQMVHAADVNQLWIADGTLIPVRDRKVAASSRNYRFSANVQVIIDADTRLAVAQVYCPRRLWTGDGGLG